MQSGVAVFPAVFGILLLVFFGLMFVAGTVGTILFLAGNPGSGVRRVGGAMALVCVLFLGVLLVLGTVLVGYRQSQEQFVRAQTIQNLKRMGEELHRRSGETERIESKPEQPVIIPDNVDAGLQRLPEDAVPPSASASANSGAGPVQSTTTAAQPVQRPAWTDIPLLISGDVSQTVLTSKQYATVDEARQEVAAEAVQLLVQDFEKIYGTSADGLRALPLETLKTMAVRQEYVETVDRDFGNFFAPMHRVWWQLELSPVVRTNLHQIWKGQTQELRILIVGGALIAVTLGLAGISLFSHRRRPVPAPEPPPAKAAAVVLGIGALTLIAQRCKRWWRT